MYQTFKWACTLEDFVSEYKQKALYLMCDFTFGIVHHSIITIISMTYIFISVFFSVGFMYIDVSEEITPLYAYLILPFSFNYTRNLALSVDTKGHMPTQPPIEMKRKKYVIRCINLFLCYTFTRFDCNIKVVLQVQGK